jgi:hypothetical protein
MPEGGIITGWLAQVVDSPVAVHHGLCAQDKVEPDNTKGLTFIVHLVLP